MSLQRPVSRLVLTARPRIESVWNENKIPNVAGDRFTQGKLHRQYISSGPGPLEARKRNVKRRLAYVPQNYERGVEPFDPCLLAGTIAHAQSGQWQWQSPSSTSKPQKDASIPLPSWLTDMIHESRQKSAKTAEAEQEVVQKARTTYREHAFFRAIRGCESVAQIRQNAATLNIDVCNHSPRVFHQLFETSRSLRICLTYLEDFSLGHPENGNLGRLLAWILPEIRDSHPEDLEPVGLLLASWVKAQLSLGLRSELEINDMITFIDELAIEKDLRFIWRDLIIALLQGLNSSIVLKPQDLSPATLQSLLALASQAELGCDTRIPASELIHGLPSTISAYPVIDVSNFIVGCFKSQTADIDGEANLDWQQELMPRIIAILRDLPIEIAGQIIRFASKHLIEWQSVTSGSITSSKSSLDRWWLMLARRVMPLFDQRGCEDLDLERHMPLDRLDILVSYAQNLADTKKSVFILWNWFASRLPRHRMTDILMSLANAIDRKEAPVFVCLLRIIRDEGLLDSDFAWHIFRLLRRMHMYNTMTQILIECRSIGLHIPPSIVRYAIPRILTSSSNSYGRILRHDRQLLSEIWPEQVQHVIGLPNQHPNTVWHHMQIRDSRNHATTWVKNKENARQASAQMLETMASTYADATHLTSRMVLRQVHRCYLAYKHGDFGPLTSNLTRAIVHGALIRPLQERQGVSTAVINWVLGLIRQIEGSVCADEIDRMLYRWRKVLRQSVDSGVTVGMKSLPDQESVLWRYQAERRHNRGRVSPVLKDVDQHVGVVPIRCIYGERKIKIKRPMTEPR